MLKHEEKWMSIFFKSYSVDSLADFCQFSKELKLFILRISFSSRKKKTANRTYFFCVVKKFENIINGIKSKYRI